MDAAYQIFVADIKPVKCRMEMKKCRNMLSGAFNSYWKRFFAVFDKDETDTIVDIMDGYSEFINNQIIQLKVAAMNVIVKYVPDFPSQKILASCFVCCALCSCANTVHELIFKNSLGEDKKDTYITAVERHTRTFSDWYIERYTDCTEMIPVGSDEGVRKVIDALVGRLASYPDLSQKQ
jgi:hypothetical protein